MWLEIFILDNYIKTLGWNFSKIFFLTCLLLYIRTCKMIPSLTYRGDHHSFLFPTQSFFSKYLLLIQKPPQLYHFSCPHCCRIRSTTIQTRPNWSWKWIWSSPIRQPSWIPTICLFRFTIRCCPRWRWSSRSWLAFEVRPRTTRNWLPNLCRSSRNIFRLRRSSRRR